MSHTQMSESMDDDGFWDDGRTNRLDRYCQIGLSEFTDSELEFASGTDLNYEEDRCSFSDFTVSEPDIDGFRQ